jgi:hypothetical protein
MIDFLLGVPGKLATIYTYLTSYLSATRCAKIDNLDVNIISRAPSSTALSTAVWSNATADKINLGGIPGTVKSIQSGYVNAAGTVGAAGAEDEKYLDVTIAAVVVAKCVVQVSPGFYNRFVANGVDGNMEVYPEIRSGRVTSTTNLRLGAASPVNSIRGRWAVIEYY